MSAVAKHRAEVEFFRDHPGEAFDEALLLQPVTYQVEQWLDALPELKLLFEDHWQEIALDKDVIKLDPDYDQYETMARMGSLHLVTARREDGVLLGYHLSIIRNHLHYRNSLTCFSDVFYLRPAYRKGMTGYRLLKFFRDSVKERGVQKIYMATKLFLDIDPLLRRLGFNAIERTYTLVFP